MPDTDGRSRQHFWIERWHDISSTLDAALEMPTAERDAYVARHCGGDVELRHEVERFLEACDTAARTHTVIDDESPTYLEPLIAEVDAAAAEARGALPTIVSEALAGKYHVERELGRGGMATVFLARDPQSGTRVAIKVMHLALARQLGAERFLEEIAITRSLRHEHIIPVLGADAVEGLLYYVMPYIEGQTLKDRLARESQLTVEDSITIARDVAHALDEAHAHGIVHRDIKPQNILLGPSGAVVADFGVARAIEAASSREFTGTNVVVGTPAYMSPEQAAGERQLDARSDVYALACVVYEMLTGEPPYIASTARGLAAKHIHAPIPEARLLRPGLTVMTADVLRRALAKQPADRFRSAGDFVEALAAAQNAGTQRDGTPISRRSRQRRVLSRLALGTIAVFALIATGVFTLRSARAARGPVVPLRTLVSETADAMQDTAVSPIVADLFRSGLALSPTLSILPAAEIREVLQSMIRSATTRIDETVGREVAARRGLTAFVASGVVRVGDRYVVSARLIDTKTGSTITAVQDQARDRDAIIPVVDRLSRQLRKATGESLRRSGREVPLVLATTASFAAFQKYSEARTAFEYEVAIAKGMKLMDQAIALDSTFSSAYRRRGIWRANDRDSIGAQQDLERAVFYKDRLSDPERHFTLATYYLIGPRPDRDKAIAEYEALIASYPTSSMAMNNLAFTVADDRAFARAESLEVRAAEIGPYVVNIANGLFRFRVSLGKMREAERTIAQFDSAFPSHFNTKWMRWDFAHVRGRYDSVAASMAAEVERDHRLLQDRPVMKIWLGHVADLHGKLAEARRWRAEWHLLRGTRDRGGRLDLGVDVLLQRAWILGDLRTLAHDVDSLVASVQLDSVPDIQRPYERLVQLYALAGDVPKAKTMLARYERSPVLTVNPWFQANRNRMRAHIALAEHRSDDAIRDYQNSDSGRCVVCVLPHLARAYELGGNADSAIAVLSRYVESTFWDRRPTDAVHLPRTFERLGQLYEQKGDSAEATRYYGRFIDVWKKADPELQPRVLRARQRVAALKRVS
jgi:serine/threonine-protein kinase